MQHKKITEPIIALLAFSIFLGACAAAPAQPTGTPAPMPDTPVPATETPETVQEDEQTSGFNPVVWMAWLADNKTLAVTSQSAVYLFDTHAGVAVRTLEKGGAYWPAALDPQGTHLLAGQRAWDTTTGRPLYQLTASSPSKAVFSPDGKMLAMGEDNAITLWDASTGEFLKDIGAGLGDTWAGLAFNADGSRLYGVYPDHKVREVDVLSGQVTERFSMPENGCCALFSQDAKHMMVQIPNHSLGNPQLWDVQRGEQISVMVGCGIDVFFTAFSVDGKYFILGPCGPDAQLWDIQSGEMLHAFPGTDSNGTFPTWWATAAFSPDGSKVALGNEGGQITIWDLASYQLLNTFSLPAP